ncbi:GNAT family N-acetyltransferase [Rhizobium sp. RAF36]|uniref:GNAT family N-acetyltransferase n=1 Tax=Rhizobium sp. RAF36 TaxID=3233055 RepID=UPI003F9E81DF
MDYLVNLSALPADKTSQAAMTEARVTVRRALPPELKLIIGWIEDKFGSGWASEATVAMTRQPPTCFVATRDGALIGFACHEATARGFFGPTGVDENARGLGIGRALLFASLNDLKSLGYAYAIIGDVGPSAFYEKAVAATPIPNSEPGIYAGMLKTDH